LSIGRPLPNLFILTWSISLMFPVANSTLNLIGPNVLILYSLLRVSSLCSMARRLCGVQLVNFITELTYCPVCAPCPATPRDSDHEPAFAAPPLRRACGPPTGNAQCHRTLRACADQRLLTCQNSVRSRRRFYPLHASCNPTLLPSRLI
jgi:hypothetical protein